MPVRRGWFDPEAQRRGLFEVEVNQGGLFDAEFVADSAASFNAAFLAAMNWPWPVRQLDVPAVVASGMTPPDTLIP